MIICISRTEGSAGTDIGFALADKLHLNYYDAEIFKDIVLRKDAPVYAASLEEIASRYSFGIQSNEEGVLYAEACTEGYHVITHKQENMDTEVSLELLFNALIKGGGRI